MKNREILTAIANAAAEAHVTPRQAREFIAGNEAALKSPSQQKLVRVLGEKTFDSFRAHLKPSF